MCKQLKRKQRMKVAASSSNNQTKRTEVPASAMKRSTALPKSQRYNRPAPQLTVMCQKSLASLPLMWILVA